jgi:hypothetical protein
MSITITSGNNGSQVASEIANAFDKRTDNTVLGDITIANGKKITTPSIKTDKITDSQNNDALILNTSNSTAKLYNGRIITDKTPFSNQGIINIKPQYDLPIDSLTINSVVFPFTIYTDIKDFYYVGNVGTTYTIVYNYAGITWTSTIVNLQGGVTECIVEMNGNRTTKTSGYVSNENKFYMYFKTSATWYKPTNKTIFDVFLVGGGGKGGNAGYGGDRLYSGGGGGGGLCTTSSSINLTNNNYEIIVGGGNGNSTAFGLSANAGTPANYFLGGSGGSGGGSGGSDASNGYSGSGGSDGSNGGGAGTPTVSGGVGSNITTREFKESTSNLYSGGGGGGYHDGYSWGHSAGKGGLGGGGTGGISNNMDGSPGTQNTGGGGGGAGTRDGYGSGTGGNGGSGIVVVRWSTI